MEFLGCCHAKTKGRAAGAVDDLCRLVTARGVLSATAAGACCTALLLAYAVLLYNTRGQGSKQRGFGRLCGEPDLPTQGACTRGAWL